MKRTYSILLLILFSSLGFSQVDENPIFDSIRNSFLIQSQLYPQEKLYVQIDKPYYIVGEDVWFRAHLTDALTSLPDTTSRYIYGELIDPLDSVKVRVKIRPVDGAYFGRIALDESLPSGDYQLRFYTRFMEGRGDDYFFKRTIKVGDPLSALYRINMLHSYSDDNKDVGIKLSFSDIKDGEKMYPDEVRIRTDKGELKVKECNDQGEIIISQKSKDKKNIVYVEYDYSDKFHKEFIPIPNPEDFEVSFLPEGGDIVLGESQRIAFKSLNSNGLGENIDGTVINAKGDTLTSFSTQHLGMGAFYLHQTYAEDKLYAVCRNKEGKEKKFELPTAIEGGVALHTNWQRERLYITLKKSAGSISSQPLYLIIQSRGIAISVSQWDEDKEFVILTKDQLPTGISQLLLIDKDFNPVSERLVFNINETDLADISFQTDKNTYKRREKVAVEMGLNSIDSISEFANVSLSITNDLDVKLDSCVNILSTILITSDLKGYIEDPAYYFRNKDQSTQRSLDLLMMTQGWSRYDVSKILKQEFDKPKSYLELGPEISGTVEGGLLMNKKSANYPVRLVALKESFFDETVTDESGRFRFNGFEFPDSTQFVVQGNTKKGGARVMLTVDQEVFPNPIFSFPYNYDRRDNLFNDYLNRADQKFILDNGMRMIYLKDVEVTASRRKIETGKSAFSSPFNSRFTLEDIEQFRSRDLYQLLSRFAGVMISGRNVSIRGGGSPLVILDNIPFDMEMLDNILIEDVEEVEIMKDAGSLIFGSRGINGVILITTKRGAFNKPAEQFNIKSVSPLGYQAVKEFYSPRYETVEQKNSEVPDLRSTIYWNPSMKISNTESLDFDFYAADAATTYSVIIEGITTKGRLIYSTHKIKRED